MERQSLFISIIIPAKNEEARLPDALRRLADLRREYPRLEVVVSVNDSSDRTEEFARARADRVVVSSDAGVSAARNRAGALARGDILIFADADTKIGPGVLSRIAAVVVAGPIVGSVTAYPEHPRVRARVVVWWKNFVRWSGLIKGMSEVVFVSRSIFFDENVCFDEGRHLGEVYDFMRRARAKGAHYRYLRSKEGYSLSMRRYDRNGYFHTVVFWVRFWFITRILRGPGLRFRDEYWK